MNSQQAIDRIRQGVSRFRTEVFPAQSDKFARLAHTQDPLAFFITCADSRIVPNLITQTGPGELFNERNPGNLVPRHEEFIGGVSAAIEYAMLVLRVPLAIICGHTDCGVMKSLLHPDKVLHLPAITDWMRHAKDARYRVLREAAHQPEEVQLQLLTQYNVQLQMENLSSHPSVRTRLDAGDLEILGWVYDVGNGGGWELNRQTRTFEPFAIHGDQNR